MRVLILSLCLFYMSAFSVEINNLSIQDKNFIKFSNDLINKQVSLDEYSKGIENDLNEKLTKELAANNFSEILKYS